MCLLYPWSNCYQLLLYRSEIKWNRISCISSPFFTLRSNLTLSHISVGPRACVHHCCQGWLHKPHLISFRTFISSCPLSQLFPRICFLLWTCWFCCFGLCHKDTNSFYHVFLPIQESVVNPTLRWVLITFITATLAHHTEFLPEMIQLCVNQVGLVLFLLISAFKIALRNVALRWFCQGSCNSLCLSPVFSQKRGNSLNILLSN